MAQSTVSSIPTVPPQGGINPNGVYSVNSGLTGLSVSNYGQISTSTSTLGNVRAAEVQIKDLVIDGHSILDTLASIQERLNLLVPNPKLEEEWASLAELGRQYRERERVLLERAKIMQILNDD